MDMMAKATELLSDKLGTDVDPASIPDALSGLFGEEGVDIGGVISGMMENGGLSSLLGSWFGDGDNAAISADQITGLFGDGKLADFAAKLGIDADQAKEALAGVLPDLMDQASSGGALMDSAKGMLESAGGVGGLLNTVKGFFK